MDVSLYLPVKCCLQLGLKCKVAPRMDIGFISEIVLLPKQQNKTKIKQFQHWDCEYRGLEQKNIIKGSKGLLFPHPLVWVSLDAVGEEIG